MRRLIFFAIVTFCITIVATAQSTALTDFNTDRLTINKRGMLVLGVWGLSNVIAGGIGAATSSGESKYFWGMNAGWGAVNTIIAGFSYKSALVDPASFTLAETLSEQQFINQFLLFNAGLDAAYMVTGLYLKERSRRFETGQENYNRLRGFGNALLVQGGFLMLFDFTMFFIHQSNSKLLYQLMETVTFASNGVGVVWRF